MIAIHHPFFSVKVKDAHINDLLVLFEELFLRMDIAKDGHREFMLQVIRRYWNSFVRHPYRDYLNMARKNHMRNAARTELARLGYPRVMEEDRKEDFIVAESKITDIAGSAIGPRIMSAYMQSTGHIDEEMRLRATMHDREFELLIKKLTRLLQNDIWKETKLYDERSDDERERDEAKNKFAIDQMILHDGKVVRSIFTEYPIVQQYKGSKIHMPFESWYGYIVKQGMKYYEDDEDDKEDDMIDFFNKFNKWKKMTPSLIRPSFVASTSLY